MALLSAIALVQPLRAQTPDTAGAARLLIQPSSQKWVYRETLSFRGDTECTQGENWRFRSGGRLDVVRCIDGHLVSSAHRWSIRSASPIDLDMDVTGGDSDRFPFLGTYRLLFRDDGKAMVLRRMPSSKSGAFEDLTFRRAAR
ncbi:MULTISPECIES: hypothetical protein [unclassified Novosphingobium]|uniref:hypothetical protein n=1 Tax=unclassified Novosphingobium TaxID=2644732 RepID=UPI001356D2C1|nr:MULTISPECIES: hypothetical protein [unclassified Novosphingobium]